LKICIAQTREQTRTSRIYWLILGGLQLDQLYIWICKIGLVLY